MSALEVLREHQLLTSRSGRAICSEPECEWKLDFPPIAYDAWLDGGEPVWVGESHAAHQLELLKAEGFSQAGNTKADVALRCIADEVSLITVGGVKTGDCGPVFYSPIYPVPRGVREIEAILKAGGWAG